MKIEVNENEVMFFSPYHPATPAAAKALGGKWDGQCWVFAPQDEGRVGQMAHDIYGYGEDTTTIQYRVSGERGQDVKDFFKFGRMIAQRMSRDEAVRIGEGVIILEGKFTLRGGSAKYPSIIGQGHTEVLLEIRDVPVNLIDHDDPNIQVIAGMPNQNPLAAFSNQMLIDEMKRRGLWNVSSVEEPQH